MQKILTFITLISMMFASMSSSECLQPRKHKKESLKKIQQKVLEQSKEIIIESSNLTAAVGESIAEGSALPQELGLRIKDVAQYVKEVVEVLDDGQEGLLAGNDKILLKNYSEKLIQMEVTIKKCKDDVDSYKLKNIKVIQ